MDKTCYSFDELPNKEGVERAKLYTAEQASSEPAYFIS